LSRLCPWCGRSFEVPGPLAGSTVCDSCNLNLFPAGTKRPRIIGASARRPAHVLGWTVVLLAALVAAGILTWSVRSRRNRKPVAPSESPELMATLRAFPYDVTSLAFRPDGTRLLVGLADGSMQERELGTDRNIFFSRVSKTGIRDVAYSPDCESFAGGLEEGRVKFWNARDGLPRFVCVGHAGPVYAIAFNPDGRSLASASEDGTVRLWDTTDGQPIRTLTGHSGGVWWVGFCPRGDCLGSAGADRVVRIWSATDGRPLHRLEGHKSLVIAGAFSPDHRHLATGSSGHEVLVWDLGTAQAVMTLETEASLGTTSLAYSPDGLWLAAAVHPWGRGRPSNAVEVWNAVSGRRRCLLNGHQDWVNRVTFNRDGKFLASGSKDRTVKLWGLHQR
jgi:WD40 repeat protein